MCLVAFVLASYGNYLVTLTRQIEIRSKYSLKNGIRAFGYLNVVVFKMAEENYIKMVTLKGS